MLTSQSARERGLYLENAAKTVETVEDLREILAGTKMSFDMQATFWLLIPGRQIPVTTVAAAMALCELIPKSKDSDVWEAAQDKIELINPRAPDPLHVGKIFDTFESHGLPIGYGLVEYMVEAKDYTRLGATPSWVFSKNLVQWVIRDPELWSLIEKNKEVEVASNDLVDLAQFFPKKVLAYVTASARSENYLARDFVGVLAPRLETHGDLVELLCKEAEFTTMVDDVFPTNLSGLRPTVAQLHQLLAAYPTKWETILTGIPSLPANVVDSAIKMVEGENLIHPAALAPHRWLPSEESVAKYLELCVDTKGQTPVRAAIEDLVREAENGQCVESLKRVVEHCTTARSIEELKDDLLAILDCVPLEKAEDVATAVFRHAANLCEPTHPGVVAVITVVFGVLCYHVDLNVWYHMMAGCWEVLNAIGPDVYRIMHDTNHPSTREVEALLIRRVLCGNVVASGEALGPCTRAFTVDFKGIGEVGPEGIRAQALATLVRSPLRVQVIEAMIRANAPHIATTIMHLVDRIGFDAELLEKTVGYLTTLGGRDRTEDDTRLLAAAVELLERRYVCDFVAPTTPFHVLKWWWEHMWTPTVDWRWFMREIQLGRSETPEELIDLGQRLCVHVQTPWNFYWLLFDAVAPWETYYWLREHWESNTDGEFLVETARFVPDGTPIPRAKRTAMITHMMYGGVTQFDLAVATRVLLKNPLCGPMATLTTGLLRAWRDDEDGGKLATVLSTSIDDDNDFIEAYMHLRATKVVTNEATVAFGRLMFDNAALMVETSQDPGLLNDFTRSYDGALVSKQVREWLVNKKYSSEWREAVLRHALVFDITVTPDLPEGSLQAEDIPIDTGKPWPKCFLAAVAYTEGEVEFVEEPKSTGWF